MMPPFPSPLSSSTKAVIVAACVAPLAYLNNIAWLGPTPATCIVVPTQLSLKLTASGTSTVTFSVFSPRSHHGIKESNRYENYSREGFHVRESRNGWFPSTRKHWYGRGEIIMHMSSTREDENDSNIHGGEKEIESQETNETSKHDNLIQITNFNESNGRTQTRKRPRYSLGLGKNRPLTSTPDIDNDPNSISASSQEQVTAALNWNAPEPVSKPDLPNSQRKRSRYNLGVGKNAPVGGISNQSRGSLRYLANSVGNTANSATNGDSNYGTNDNESNVQRGDKRTRTRRLLTLGGEESARLTKAVWDEGHFDQKDKRTNGAADSILPAAIQLGEKATITGAADEINVDKQIASADDEKDAKHDKQSIVGVTTYEQIDLSVPPSVYSLGSYTLNNTNSEIESSEPIDLVWDLMRSEAQTEAEREPLLVSFLYSTILNHPSLESALSFHLANRLSSPAMLSTQIMSLIREALDADPEFRRNLRADILAVRDRDPACTCLPDVFLYFKGFHALQTYRVAHYLWKSGRRILAHYLQSQVSQNFQIDIHPNATLGSGIMLDHGTGIVIGETAHLGHNCSVLHHVTLGGSGKKGVDRHPKVGNGVLLGAGASVLGNIKIGDGCQVGAGTLVIEDLPPGVVAVGVPAKIIGKFVDITAQPSIGMNQLGSKEADENIIMYGMDGI